MIYTPSASKPSDDLGSNTDFEAFNKKMKKFEKLSDEEEKALISRIIKTIDEKIIEGVEKLAEELYSGRSWKTSQYPRFPLGSPVEGRKKLRKRSGSGKPGPKSLPKLQIPQEKPQMKPLYKKMTFVKKKPCPKMSKESGGAPLKRQIP
ncbi:hypothetical protein L873DRAFT_1803821 [Choiromyces venosus 120613-1]|uniref:Uncharacterized protein n=1 Tax=Choiromyces venosus 120613-1 TaxID=1336337 RepID=A0A3N4JSZ8_9PEZI|nr:hypothetical protein L873DRAFT_1803821 [Choiromyces venosus 120613-1]